MRFATKLAWIIAGGTAMIAAAVIPYVEPIYAPAMPGAAVQSLSAHLTDDFLPQRIMLSDAVLNEQATQHRRFLGVYQFSWPKWRRIYFNGGSERQIFADSGNLPLVYGESVGQSFTVGDTLTIAGIGSFINGSKTEQIVLHVHDVAGSGQYEDSFIIVAGKHGPLRRLVMVQNYMGLTAAITGDHIDLVGDRHNTAECMQCLIEKDAKAQLSFDGLHWGLLPNPSAFPLKDTP